MSTKSTNQITEQVFLHYYPKLVEILPMNDATFRATLVPHGLLPGDLKQQVEEQKTSRDKAAHFLDNAIKPSVMIGDDNAFTKLLIVMADCDFQGVGNLAKQIKGGLADNGISEYHMYTNQYCTISSHSDAAFNRC